MRQRAWLMGLPASVIVHAVCVVLLVFMVSRARDLPALFVDLTALDLEAGSQATEPTSARRPAPAGEPGRAPILRGGRAGGDARERPAAPAGAPLSVRDPAPPSASRNDEPQPPPPPGAAPSPPAPGALATERAHVRESAPEEARPPGVLESDLRARSASPLAPGDPGRSESSRRESVGAPELGHSAGGSSGQGSVGADGNSGQGPVGPAGGGSDGAGGSAGAGGGGGASALASRSGGAGGGGSGAEYGPYLRLWRTRIHENIRYPAAARRRNLTGTVQIEIVIEPSGALARVAVVESSTHEVLDAAAIEAARDLAPIPFPSHLVPRPLRARLPIVFDLQ